MISFFFLAYHDEKLLLLRSDVMRIIHVLDILDMETHLSHSGLRTQTLLDMGTQGSAPSEPGRTISGVMTPLAQVNPNNLRCTPNLVHLCPWDLCGVPATRIHELYSGIRHWESL